jgi:NAD(P) transhydrogenase
MDEVYDLVVIGAGPAGEVAAELAAAFGRRVLVVERDKPGGVVTTTGGAPTKALREAAVDLTGYRQEEVYGVRAALPLNEILRILRARVERVRDVLQEAVGHRLAARGIGYLQGTACVGRPGTVRVTSSDGVEHRLARAVLVATGSRPTHFAGVPFDDPDVYDSDQVYSLRTVPEDIVVVGGGAMGVEFATVLTALGIPATLICRSDRLLPAVDGELAELAAEEFQRRGVRLILGADAKAVCRQDGRLTVTLSTGPVLTADAVLFATGRTPNLKASGSRRPTSGSMTADGSPLTASTGRPLPGFTRRGTWWTLVLPRTRCSRGVLRRPTPAG